MYPDDGALAGHGARLSPRWWIYAAPRLSLHPASVIPFLHRLSFPSPFIDTPHSFHPSFPSFFLPSLLPSSPSSLPPSFYSFLCPSLNFISFCSWSFCPFLVPSVLSPSIHQCVSHPSSHPCIHPCIYLSIHTYILTLYCTVLYFFISVTRRCEDKQKYNAYNQLTIWLHRRYKRGRVQRYQGHLGSNGSNDIWWKADDLT